MWLTGFAPLIISIASAGGALKLASANAKSAFFKMLNPFMASSLESWSTTDTAGGCRMSLPAAQTSSARLSFSLLPPNNS